MATKDEESRTSVKLRISTKRMVQETGISGDSIDELIRRLLFVKKTGKSDPTTTEDKIARRI